MFGLQTAGSRHEEAATGAQVTVVATEQEATLVLGFVTHFWLVHKLLSSSQVVIVVSACGAQ